MHLLAERFVSVGDDSGFLEEGVKSLANGTNVAS
jgi:hypothetical protein